ncbi:hypothetical protein [Halothiobacillus sp. DCM-1]|uniref:hypothetical protein n=1 Tax=Halothiobacillus sp. DCM-1 TaxID=3112558 RepID=UPI0032483B22
MAARTTRRFTPTAWIVAAALGLSSATVLADDTTPAAPAAAPTAPAMPQLTPEQMKLMKDFQQTRQELDVIEQKLQALETKAFDKNPKLVKERDGLRDAIKSHMSDKNYDAQAEYDKLKALVTKIQGTPDSDPQKMKDIQTFRAGQQEFESRQQKAFEDPKIQKQSEKLRNDVRADMIKLDPSAKGLFDDLDKKEKHLHDLQTQAMQMQGSMQVAPAAPAPQQ